MAEFEIYNTLILAIIIAAGLTFVALFFVTAPYGRHLRTGWGPTVPARIGWIVMESPTVLFFAYVYAIGEHAMNAAPLVLLSLWLLHYLYRTFVYPFRLRNTAQRMPLSIVAMAIGFNCINAYINARWLSHFGDYADGWLSSPVFLLGVTIFFLGWVMNQHSDQVLLRLRAAGGSGYSIPQGGMYRLVSCPNYLGEMLAWIGWAIAAWSLAGLAFALFSIANLLPRAIANHRWYLNEFANYPGKRKAVIPYLL